MGGADQVDEYIDTLPEERRAWMQELRTLLIAGAPGAQEAISYKMPALRMDGSFFMSYDAFKAHYSLFPATDDMEKELGAELTPYLSGKGTLRFAADKPLPVDLVRRIVEIRLREFQSRPADRSAGR
jgi:uncharacterized protein YdhG (YjbR/CyaY superfamily)